MVSTILEITGSAFITNYWKYNAEDAGKIASISPFSCVLIPILGKLIDKCGIPTEMNIFASILHILSSLMMLYINPPYIAYFLFGIGFTLRNTLTYPILDVLVLRNC